MNGSVEEGRGEDCGSGRQGHGQDGLNQSEAGQVPHET